VSKILIVRGALFMALLKFAEAASAAEEIFSKLGKPNQHDKQKTPQVPEIPGLSGLFEFLDSGCFKFEIEKGGLQRPFHNI